MNQRQKRKFFESIDVVERRLQIESDANAVTKRAPAVSPKHDSGPYDLIPATAADSDLPIPPSFTPTGSYPTPNTLLRNDDIESLATPNSSLDEPVPQPPLKGYKEHANELRARLRSYVPLAAAPRK